MFLRASVNLQDDDLFIVTNTNIVGSNELFARFRTCRAVRQIFGLVLGRTPSGGANILGLSMDPLID